MPHPRKYEFRIKKSIVYRLLKSSKYRLLAFQYGRNNSCTAVILYGNSLENFLLSCKLRISRQNFKQPTGSKIFWSLFPFGLQYRPISLALKLDLVLYFCLAINVALESSPFYFTFSSIRHALYGRFYKLSGPFFHDA